MFNLNLFKQPIELSTLESWSKFCDDVGKVAFIAIPPMIYSDYDLISKTVNVLLYVVGVIHSYLWAEIYVSLLIRRKQNGLNVWAFVS